MKDHAVKIALESSGSHAKLNSLREYLQAYILKILHGEKFFRHAAFMGGTALRFLYDLPRFSEDLDFFLEHKKDYSFMEVIKKTKKELELSGYQVSAVYRDEKTVQYVLFKFEGLLYEAGLSQLPGQKFSIKLEVDTNPPEGARKENKILHKFFPVAFLVYDISSLFSGKLTAIFCRKYTKGRDYFDLGWYLTRFKNLAPNFKLLGNGLNQMHWQGELPGEQNWRAQVSRHVERVNWKKVHTDIENLIEDPRDLKIFTQENLISLIQSPSS